MIDRHRLQRFTSLTGVCAALLLPLPAHGQSAKKIDFAHDIVPILKARCAECHTNGKYKAGLSMDTRAALLKSKVVVPGKSKSSELIQRITSQDAETRMPQKGKPLSAQEIDLVRKWIDEGLPWEAGFTFKVSAYVAPLKPRRPVLPKARGDRDHPIDRIVDAYLARNKVAQPTPLEDPAFLRRVYLDLVGLPPAPSEIESFLTDSAPDKRHKLIAKLLDERRSYADHWLTFWNDLLRNDYAGTGYIDGGRKQISAWLYRSLQDNKPYDQFVRELINPGAESEGFIRGIQWRGNVNASQVVELQFAQNVSQVFFGVNMKCASCHDSFIDNWKLDDAYALAAVVSDRPLEIHRCDKAIGKKAVARFIWPELGSIAGDQPRGKRLEQFAGLVTHPQNGRFTRTIANRLWQRFMGRGIVHPVDVMANKPWSDDLLDYLAVYLVDQRYDLKKLMAHIVTSRTYQARAVPLDKETAGDDYVFHGPEVRRLTAEQFIDAVWMVTGTGPGKAAAPVVLPVFAEWMPAERRLMRAALVPADALMRSLGRPNREQVVTTRPDLLTTLEALDLSNGQVLTDMLNRGAEKWTKANVPGDRVIESLYRQALCRPPTLRERATAREILGSPMTAEGVADLLWTLLMLPEFQLIQ